jgi:hypothetical protein
MPTTFATSTYAGFTSAATDLCRTYAEFLKKNIHFFIFGLLNPRIPIRIEEIHSGVPSLSTPIDLSTDHLYYLVETLESILGPRSFN